MNLTSAADRWLTRIEAATPDAYTDAFLTIMLLLRTSGKRQLDQIAPGDIEAYAQFLQAEGRDDEPTIKHRVTHLRAFLDECESLSQAVAA